MNKEILGAECQAFIRENEGNDPFSLSLNKKGPSGIPMSEIAGQLASREAARRKTRVLYESDGIYYPPLVSMEQCSSDDSARYKSEIIQGQSICDLTGGAGIDAIYLSKSFNRVTYVDSNEELVRIFDHNLGILGCENIKTVHSTAEDFLGSTGKFDVIYVDPSRRVGQERVSGLSQSEPDVVELWETIKSKAGQVLIKVSPMISVPEIHTQFVDSLHIHFVAIKNELKEILVHYDPLKEGSVYTCVNLQTSDPVVRFDQSDENGADVSISDPKSYIYEPNAAIMKSGAFKLIAEKYGLSKLEINTHLYTSEKKIDFPGRVFELTDILQPKEVKSRIKKANVAVRNFPISPEEIKTKYRIKDGGDVYLYGCTLTGRRNVMLVMKRLG